MLKVYFDPKSGPTATERGGPKPDFSNLEVKFWNEYSVAMNSITQKDKIGCVVVLLQLGFVLAQSNQSNHQMHLISGQTELYLVEFKKTCPEF